MIKEFCRNTCSFRICFIYLAVIYKNKTQNACFNLIEKCILRSLCDNTFYLSSAVYKTFALVYFREFLLNRFVRKQISS